MRRRAAESNGFGRGRRVARMPRAMSSMTKAWAIVARPSAEPIGSPVASGAGVLDLDEEHEGLARELAGCRVRAIGVARGGIVTMSFTDLLADERGAEALDHLSNT